MENKTIQIKCKGADSLAIDSLKPFQGSLKKLSGKNKERLAKQIVKRFIDPIKIWQYEGINYILNGHQRLSALHYLRESGYEMPLLPVDYIMAESYQEARENVLMLDSQYGVYDQDSEEFKEWLEEIDESDRELLRLVDNEIELNTTEINEIIEGIEYKEKNELIIMDLSSIQIEDLYNELIERNFKCRISTL